jgi:amidase
MRPYVFALFLSSVFLTAQSPNQTLSGKWILIVERQGELVLGARADLRSEGGKISGKAGTFTVQGTAAGETVDLQLLDGGKPQATMKGKRTGQSYEGTAVSPEGLQFTWRAERDQDKTAPPVTHVFAPTEFQRYFSPTTKPVLHIHSGDTVKTWSVDAGGNDAKGKRQSRGGNPLTGPFYVDGALPGDTLVVRLNKVRLNRDFAMSGTEIVPNAVSPGYSANLNRVKDFSSRWKLDATDGTASVGGASEALKNLRVPLAPMLGCIAVAPPGQTVVRTGDSGDFGGNMDYNRLREGTTVYLPVSQPGALLLMGDGHAAQGDGELGGDALETSMEFEFSVEVIRDFSMSGPFAEDADSWMVIGIAGSLEDALRTATTRMARYLEAEHGLNSNEAAMVLGSSMKYDVADLVGTQVSIVARLPKSVLAQLPPRKHTL